jgi:hypothetical protein
MSLRKTTLKTLHNTRHLRGENAAGQTEQHKEPWWWWKAIALTFNCHVNDVAKVNSRASGKTSKQAAKISNKEAHYRKESSSPAGACAALPSQLPIPKNLS